LEVAFGGVLIDASVLPGFVATAGVRPVGLLTYDVARGECEVVTILGTARGLGLGRALMDALKLPLLPSRAPVLG